MVPLLIGNFWRSINNLLNDLEIINMSLNITGENFVGFERSSSGKHFFKSFNPQKNSEINYSYKFASEDEIGEVILLADKATKIYAQKTGIEKGKFLEAIEQAIILLGDDLINICIEETGLSRNRVLSERERTCKQLHLFSEILQEGSWIDARIDTGCENESVDIRRTLVGLGPVVVFGASNFPLAFSVPGGDTVSAFAAGCPVIFKAHPYHPGTSELIAGAIIQAAKKTDMPSGIFSLLHLSNNQATTLIKNRSIKAVAFTGSREAGLSLMNAVKER
jgi:2,5-dioxopentanoate dehydrogenase